MGTFCITVGHIVWEIFKKLRFSVMAAAYLHINGFLKSCPRVPAWHHADSRSIWSKGPKNAKTFWGSNFACFPWKETFDIRTKTHLNQNQLKTLSKYYVLPPKYSFCVVLIVYFCNQKTARMPQDGPGFETTPKY